ncbi:MAG: hypothetical protein NUV83_03000 [Candidatus Wolfebacteria bacterium]|nr:hypothetical protein [Candidatus Wolfebacteria bacterium]
MLKIDNINNIGKREIKVFFSFLLTIFFGFGLFFFSRADAAYAPPAGIPAPIFGINEVAPSTAIKCSSWPSAFSPECYYIDNTSPAATDIGNTNGYPNRPRATIPTTYAAGSYAEVRGGPYNSITITFNGTSANPIFFRGPSALDRTTIHGVGLTGSYAIVEYINSDLNGGNVGFLYPASYISFRNNTVQGTGVLLTGNQSALSLSGGTAGHNNNLVVYNNTIWNHGQWNYNTTADVHGIKPRNDVDEAWILENTIYHVQGDSIQTGEATLVGQSYPTKIYIGKNIMYENKENCIDIKGGTDIIVSENICHDMLNAYGDDQMEGIVTHNSANWTWYINNTIWNSGFGIYTSGSANQYAVGNVIYSIQGSSNPSSFYDYGTGIIFIGANPGAIVNNTIDNTQHGYSEAGGGVVNMANNIISNRSLAAGYDQMIENTTGNTLDYTLTSGNTKTRWGGGTYATAAAFNSATGQGAHHWETNPLFMNTAGNDYRLTASSPAINNGVLAQVYATFQNRYGISIARDINGNIRPSGTAWDIGAYEYVSGAPDTTPPAAPTGLSVN